MPLALAAWVEANASPDDKTFVSLRGESACYNVYHTADGQPLALAAIERKFWTNFSRAVEKPEWIELHTIRDQQSALIESVRSLFKTKTAAEWTALLEGADCCFTPVKSPGELRDDPQIQARGMVDVSEDGIPWMRSPIRLSGDSFELSDAPEYGEHTRAVLAEIGYGDSAIERLIELGVIRQAP